MDLANKAKLFGLEKQKPNWPNLVMMPFVHRSTFYLFYGLYAVQNI
jgi:hypothetical protein